jgi:hypothetical protein
MYEKSSVLDTRDSDILDFEKRYLESNLLDCTEIFRECPSHLALCFKHRDF